MPIRDRRPGRPLAALIVVLLGSAVAGCTSSPTRTECPDGTFVQGTKCELTADGTYIGDTATIPEDVANRTADEIDEEANEESGMEPVEVEVIVIDKT